MDAAGAARLGAEERAAAKLRSAGLRATQPRLAVYQALRHLGGHRSADEVASHLAEGQRPLPRTSVYNALQALQAAGLVMLADAGPGPILYEAATSWHHHFVCRECGQVIDVPCDIGSKPCLLPSDPRLEVDEAQVIFRGRCQTCASPPGATLPPLHE